MRPTDIAEPVARLSDEVARVIVGKGDTVRRSLLTLLCSGHLLIEDIPGVGKTTLAKSLAKVIGGEFRRIQFTPDLLPADITGSSVYNQRTSEFEFRPGPIFGNIVLVDEVNRATPKTQSALLEAMEEHQVTADGYSHTLPNPFFVIATQNTVEMTGTFPLPEAQLDRFFARVMLGYPDARSEADILYQQQTRHPLESIQTVITLDEMLQMQAAVREVQVRDNMREYVVNIVQATRSSNQFLMGASPRGSVYLMRAAQAHAAIEGRDFVKPDDVKATAPMVLAHRVMVRAELRNRGGASEEVIAAITESVPVPVA
ncbi:MAG: AAA family ATPase [Fimbriimonadaceae bacterium]